MAKLTGEVETSLTRLECEHHALSLAPTTSNIWMAHPFSARPSAYRVVGETGSWWANCAWDALAIPSMLGLDASIETSCPDCGHVFDLRVERGELAGDDGVVQFVVPPSQFWDDIGFT